MTPKPTRIPLFPLEAVLLPLMPLPLHIFEPRYKLMIRNCLDNQEKFGVILAKEKGIVSVGCTARIVELVRTYPDGRMDILTVGQDPYQVIEVFDEAPYLEAEVEYLEEVETPAAREPVPHLLDFYQKCHTLIYGSPPDQAAIVPGASLAYHIANDLPIDLDYKQELLQTRDEDHRQLDLIERLRDWLPQLEQLHAVRKKARRNGQGFG
jgi:Lon protease-like protein